MSSAADPYQPAEAKLRITRSILEVFAEHPIGLLVVQTRSPHVEEDFDILELKIIQVKKDYKEILSKKESAREKQMLTIISRMMITDNFRKDKTLFNHIQEVLHAEDKQAEGDAEILNYKIWLKEKIN